jgi:catechol 2,3-dioxygenase-like lactoylglutathione lyase family enzyme
MRTSTELAGAGLASASFYTVATVVSDLDEAIDWYGRVLGFEEQARGPIAEGEVALLRGGGGATLELLECRLPEPTVRLAELFAEPPLHVLPVGNKFLVFQVDDLAAASADLEHLGVTILWREKELAPGWRSTAIRDMDGNLVNIFQRHEPATG